MKNLVYKMMSMILLVALLAACGPPAQQTTQTEAEPSTVQMTEAPTATPTMAPTNTIQPSATLSPSSTPSITPTITLTQTPTPKASATKKPTDTPLPGVSPTLRTPTKTKDSATKTPELSNVTFVNKINAGFNVTLYDENGTPVRKFFVYRNGTITFSIKPGMYKYMIEAGGYEPLFGSELFTPGEFTWTFSNK